MGFNRTSVAASLFEGCLESNSQVGIPSDSHSYLGQSLHIIEADSDLFSRAAMVCSDSERAGVACVDTPEFGASPLCIVNVGEPNWFDGQNDGICSINPFGPRALAVPLHRTVHIDPDGVNARVRSARMTHLYKWARFKRLYASFQIHG